MSGRLYTCNHCGRGGRPAEEFVYSRHTNKRYCRDLDRCLTRAKRARSKAVAA